MHFTWTGLGYLVPVIAFGCCLGTEILVEAVTHDDRFYQAHGWPKLVALVLAAAIVAVVGRLLEGRRGRRLIDPETGAEVFVGGHDTFLFIR